MRIINLYVHVMYESDRLGSDYLGNHVYLLRKKKACGTNLGTHEHFEYGKRKKKGRRLKERKLNNR